MHCKELKYIIIENEIGSKLKIKIDEVFSVQNKTAFTFRFSENPHVNYINLKCKVIINNIKHPLVGVQKVMVEIIESSEAGYPFGILIDTPISEILPFV